MAKKTKRNEPPLIISIGGGKGGVGKSMVSANLAVQYAQVGLKVTLIDLDVGAANLHTLFGIRQPSKSLGNYFSTPKSLLANYVVKTKVENLLLIPGSGFVPELANLKHSQKVKILNQMKNLDADVVLLDLGAGSSMNVIDFFSMTDGGIIVTSPEPTAVVNAYEFLKNVMFRIFYRIFRNQDNIIEIIKKCTTPAKGNKEITIPQMIKEIGNESKWAAQTVKEVCQDLNFYLIFNQARRTSEVKLAEKLNGICKKYLGISLNFSGMLFFNEDVPSSVFKMSPISVSYPESSTSKSFKRLSQTVIQQICECIIGKPADSFEDQIQREKPNLTIDFQASFLNQKRLQREMASIPN